MVVPNYFTSRTDDRQRVLRALLAFASLFTCGLAAAFLVASGPLGLGGTRLLGLVVVLVGGLAAASRVWLVPGWDGGHGVAALLVGVAALAVGFGLPPTVGTLPILLGALTFGVGLAGFAVQRLTDFPRPAH